MKKSSIKVNNRSITLSNLDKIWFPKSKISKGDIIDYYYNVADYMVAHVKNHLLTLQRYPEGIKGESFYQKNAGTYFPDWIKTIGLKKQDGDIVNYVICKNEATIVYLVNQGGLVIHSWLSRYDKLDYPDRLIFDLDPSINNFTQVRKAALVLKEIFDDLKIPCFPMITGSKGIHIYTPLKRVHTFGQVANFADVIAQKMLKLNPKQFTLEIRKDKRGNKIFVDTLRNRHHATCVVPYSVRPIEKAPVATPLWWDEVKDPKLTPQKFTIKNILQRLKTDGDAWKDIDIYAISLKKYKQIEREL